MRDPRLNDRAEVTQGVQAAAAGQLLNDFFRARRSRRAAAPEDGPSAKG